MTAPVPVVAALAQTHAVEAFDSQIAVLLPAGSSDGAVSAFHVVAEPESGPPLHVHADEDELIYVIAGTFGFASGGQCWTGGPGTLAYLPRGVPHTWANLGQTHGRLLVVCRPGGFEGYLTEIAGRRLDSAAHAAELAELGTRFGLTLLGPNPLLAPAPAAAAADRSTDAKVV